MNYTLPSQSHIKRISQCYISLHGRYYLNYTESFFRAYAKDKLPRFVYLQLDASHIKLPFLRVYDDPPSTDSFGKWFIITYFSFYFSLYLTIFDYFLYSVVKISLTLWWETLLTDSSDEAKGGSLVAHHLESILI